MKKKHKRLKQTRKRTRIIYDLRSICLTKSNDCNISKKSDNTKIKELNRCFRLLPAEPEIEY